MRKFMMAVGVIGFITTSAIGQSNRQIDNYRYPDKNGLNVFEDNKDTISTWNGFKVRLGGSFAIQFQGLDHSNSYNAETGYGTELIGLQSNFNLPTANLDVDVALFDGMRLHLRTYLSSRHHPEPYVKGGYLQIDNLNFIKKDLLKGLMNNLTVRIGHMENNYGDAHFRRSDNAQALYNPFVGNLIMDGFTTEVGLELTYQRNGWIGVLGLTNGKLNQNVGDGNKINPSLLAKFGYDKQLTDDFRMRLTGSGYFTNKTSNVNLYGADRAGSRYYLVMEEPGATPAAKFTSGRFNPALKNEMLALMFNPFLKYKGFEFFGTYEMAMGKENSETDNRMFHQVGAELLWRFGSTENFYIGGRYNLVQGKEFATNNDIKIDRFNVGAGWFMTKNVMAKLEYVNQRYDGFAAGSRLDQGKFGGVVLEAVISF